MANKPLIEIPIIFYRSSMGTEPVREWLRTLPIEDRRVIGYDLATLQVGWPVGMPLCRPLGGSLWEIRTALPSRRIAPVLIFMHGGYLVILSGFIKQTQKTPKDELELASKRMKEITQ